MIHFDDSADLYRGKKMKRLFLDVTSSNYDGADGAICVIRKDAEIIQAGTTISSMPTELMDEEYQKFIDCYDIHFIFDNMALNVDFYAVPRVDIMAVDSRGGYIGTVGGLTDIESEFPICYIDKSRKIFRIADNFKNFVNNCADWKKQLQPCDDVKLFSSKSEAAKEYEFIDIDPLLRK